MSSLPEKEHWPERILYLDHRMLAEILEERAKLVTINPDGTANEGMFCAWAMRRVGLKPFTNYRIVVQP